MALAWHLLTFDPGPIVKIELRNGRIGMMQPGDRDQKAVDAHVGSKIPKPNGLESVNATAINQCSNDKGDPNVGSNDFPVHFCGK